GEELILDASVAGASYHWQDNSSNAVYTVASPGNYWVEITLDNCSKTDNIYITAASDCDVSLEMPNAFTPNNDGMNDNFFPVKAVGIHKFNLRIYNRWGQNLADTDDIVNGWNGKFKNEYCTSGTYYWIVEYVTIRNENLTIKGSLSLTSK
ncbi:MAG: gliding motility-associated C-terminal domain-containing protein, partial [Bacteroidota bacterium]